MFNYLFSIISKNKTKIKIKPITIKTYSSKEEIENENKEQDNKVVFIDKKNLSSLNSFKNLSYNLKKMDILIIEDDEYVINNINGTVDRNYNVEVAKNVIDAKNKFFDNEYDIIFISIKFALILLQEFREKESFYIKLKIRKQKTNFVGMAYYTDYLYLDKIFKYN